MQKKWQRGTKNKKESDFNGTRKQQQQQKKDIKTTRNRNKCIKKNAVPLPFGGNKTPPPANDCPTPPAKWINNEIILD